MINLFIAIKYERIQSANRLGIYIKHDLWLILKLLVWNKICWPPQQMQHPQSSKTQCFLAPRANLSAYSRNILWHYTVTVIFRLAVLDKHEAIHKSTLWSNCSSIHNWSDREKYLHWPKDFCAYTMARKSHNHLCHTKNSWNIIRVQSSEPRKKGM